MKILELIYALFLMSAFAAAVILVTVIWIQYDRYEEQNNGNNRTYDSNYDCYIICCSSRFAEQDHEGDCDSSSVNDSNRVQYPGYSRTMGFDGLFDEFDYYILPYIQWIGDYQLRQASNTGTAWSPAYFSPWNKPSRLRLRGEPGIQEASQLYA